MDETFLRRDAEYGHILERLGTAILKHEFRAAAYALLYTTTPSYRAQEIAEALVFIRGSGLERVIETFALEVDANQFRETFFTWAERQRRHHTSALLSATTPVAS